MNHFNKLILFYLFISINITSVAQNLLHYEISTEIQCGNGRFSPYYFTSNKHGVTSINPNSGYIRAALFKELDLSKKFSYGFGIDLAGSYNNNSEVWIQQLYGELKYRCFSLNIGSQEHNNILKNQQLSSGGLVWSGNARPIPQIRLGISEFTEIPGTKGWLQIKGDISYGLFTDKNWLEEHYNYMNWFVTTGAWYHQKKIYFRSNEKKPFRVTIGGEFAAQFGGCQKWYKKGVLTHNINNKVRFKDFLAVLIPHSGDANTTIGDQAYYYGNHIGSWQANAEYKFKNKSILKGYFEWLFEDGSGIGKLNGWDGLWGVEYSTNQAGFISSVLIEYLQTTNQSGPIHFASGDYSNTNITTEATGADDYYNNYFYNGWAHYGMSNGTAFLKSPAYNQDGFLRFSDNRVKGFHLGITGFISPIIKYRILYSYRRSWGTPFIPSLQINRNSSGFIEVRYTCPQLKNIQLLGALGFDKGNLYGDNLGISFGIRFSNPLIKIKQN